jgi:hypothetical protein
MRFMYMEASPTLESAGGGTESTSSAKLCPAAAGGAWCLLSCDLLAYTYDFTHTNHCACAQIEYSSLFDGQSSVSLPHNFLECWHDSDDLLL